MDLVSASKFLVQMGANLPTTEVDAVIFTWQMSHIRCVIDPVEDNQSAEHFLAKTFCFNKVSSHHISELPWEERIDISNWILSLNIIVAENRFLTQLLSRAASDLKESEETPEEIQFFTETLNSITLPEQGWKVIETIDPRNPIGPTEIGLFVSNGKYILIEVHNES